MFCAFAGAMLGNYVRASMLSRRFGQFSALGAGVAVACVTYLLALLGLAQVIPNAHLAPQGGLYRSDALCHSGVSAY